MQDNWNGGWGRKKINEWMGRISLSGSEWLQVFRRYQDEFPRSSMEEHSRPPQLIERNCSYQRYTQNKKIMSHCEPGGNKPYSGRKDNGVAEIKPSCWIAHSDWLKRTEHLKPIRVNKTVIKKAHLAGAVDKGTSYNCSSRYSNSAHDQWLNTLSPSSTRVVSAVYT